MRNPGTGAGDRGSTRSRSAPFGHLRPAVALSAGYGVAILVWLAAGDALPGGRWFTVHLFTLGVLSTLVLALTHHFAATLTKTARGGAPGARLALFTVGTLGVLALALSWTVPLALGAVATSAAVLWLYVDLRRMRKQALGGRFAFVVRTYERACSAFLHGALLGMLLGTGVIGGTWHPAVRLAHLHVNVLGWGGLALLATVLFFGPTVLRARIEPGADQRAVAALRHGATALTVTVIALILTGAGAPVAVPARAVAALGLAGYAAAATVICLPVLRTARRAQGNVHGRLVAGACAWFPPVVWVGAAVVATGRWALLDALGVALLVGVLAQAILGALGYLAPMVWTGGAQARRAHAPRAAALGTPCAAQHRDARARRRDRRHAPRRAERRRAHDHRPRAARRQPRRPPRARPRRPLARSPTGHGRRDRVSPQMSRLSAGLWVLAGGIRRGRQRHEPPTYGWLAGRRLVRGSPDAPR